MKTSSTSSPTDVRKLTALGLLVTLGIVFGDIGTSPLYVMQAIGRVHPGFSHEYVYGAVSLVIWTLTLQTTLKYVVIALRADNSGEGGILALYSLLRKRKLRWLYAAAIVGAATLIADGVITPAITVTSAVQGLAPIWPDAPVLGITIVIISAIFLLQQLGTGAIGRWFGPVMLLWFSALGAFGVAAIGWHPGILHAFNPLWALRLLFYEPEWFLVLGAVFLCTTGAEALYSDLGHCGRPNISVAWIFVKLMLIFNYMGQGAWMAAHAGRLPADINPFYGILPGWAVVPMVVLAACAAVIASQALISGSFTIFSEAMSLHFFPRLRISYPASVKGQLYIGKVNWALYFGCLLTVLYFRTTEGMEAAYGLAITVTMLTTTLLLAFWMRGRGVPRWLTGVFLGVFGLVEGCFFVANCFKFPHGGWFTILIAGAVCAVMLVWRNAGLIRDSYREWTDIGRWFGVISDLKDDSEVPKFASNLIYVANFSDQGEVDSKLIHSILNKHPKRADRYWIFHIDYVDQPRTLSYSVSELVADTLYRVNLRLGYCVEPRINVYLRQIVEDLQASGELDIMSRYPSLRRHGVVGDFRFVVIHRVFSRDSVCPPAESLMMRLYERIRCLGISTQEALGLDTSLVTVETVPLIISKGPLQRIKRDNC